MTETILWVLALVVAPLLVAKADLWRKSVQLLRSSEMNAIRSWWESENMPRELRGATLFLNEQDISTTEPVALHGRVDQVFKTIKGVLVPVDTKTRDTTCIFKSDIIQLSVYRVILEAQYGSQYKVSRRGYVRVVIQSGREESVRYMPVELLSERKVAALWRRYNALRSGETKGKCTCDGHLH